MCVFWRTRRDNLVKWLEPHRCASRCALDRIVPLPPAAPWETFHALILEGTEGADAKGIPPNYAVSMNNKQYAV